MGKKVILNEAQLSTILNKMAEDVLVKEEKRYPINPQQVLIVKEFLDNTFERGLMDSLDNSGMPCQIQIAIMKAPSGQELKKMFRQDLEDLLNEKYKAMFSNEEQRVKFLKQVVSDWYDDKIGTYGNLSKNYV